MEELLGRSWYRIKTERWTIFVLVLMAWKVDVSSIDLIGTRGRERERHDTIYDNSPCSQRSQLTKYTMYVHVDILVYCIVRLAQVLWSDFIFMVTAVFISSNTPILYCPIITENYKGFFFSFLMI